MIKGRKYHKPGTKYDEYYTTLEEVEYIFNEVINEDFTDKIIYCPFDNDDSAFVKYISEHKDEFKYKEFWHTSDDFKNHEDLIQKCDVIISNPPFSLIYGEILPMFKKYDKKFFLFGSLSRNDAYVKIYSPNEIKYFRRGEFKFYTPHINEQTNDYWCYVANTIYMTNFKCKENFKQMKKPKNFLMKSFEDIDHIYDVDGILTIDKMSDFPNDYYEFVRGPITLLQYKFMDEIEFINRKNKLEYSDNKSRYVRLCFQRKKKHFE